MTLSHVSSCAAHELEEDPVLDSRGSRPSAVHAAAQDFVRQALCLVLAAARHERDGGRARALALYAQSTAFFMQGMDHEPNAAAREAIRRRAAKYAEHAARLRAVTADRNGENIIAAAPTHQLALSRSAGGRHGCDNEHHEVISDAVVADSEQLSRRDVAGVDVRFTVAADSGAAAVVALWVRNPEAGNQVEVLVTQIGPLPPVSWRQAGIPVLRLSSYKYKYMLQLSQLSCTNNY